MYSNMILYMIEKEVKDLRKFLSCETVNLASGLIALFVGLSALTVFFISLS